MKASEYIIVIGRQFGCGARKLGTALAEKLGIPYYDKELLSHAAQKCGMRPEIFAQTDECRPSLLRSMTEVFFGLGSECFSRSSMSPDSIYEMQSKVIRDICAKGPCIIVGRTADYVARDLPNIASIFLHAPIDYRTKTICSRGDSDCQARAAELARRRDHDRENYYNYYTGRQWGAASNYDLCLDCSSLPLDNAVELIIKWLESRDSTI